MKQILLILLLICPPLDSSAAEPDMAGQKGETVFFLLGMLDEYNGRYFTEGGRSGRELLLQ